ncbi:MAG: hypothetical protein WAP14_05930 [Acetomicrobium sp.]
MVPIRLTPYFLEKLRGIAVMKNIILILVFMLLILNPCFALDLRQNIVEEQKPDPVKQTPIVEEEVPLTNAFICLVKIFNMCYPYGQIDETILEDTWKLIKTPALYDLSQGLRCFSKLENVRNIDYIPKPEKYEKYKVYVDYIKNTKPVMGAFFCLYPVRICTAEDLKARIADKDIAYVHVGEASDDKAYVVMGARGNKAVVFNGKTNMEMDFDELVKPANYILVFSYEFIK